MTTIRQLHLGLNLSMTLGAHRSAWRHPESDPLAYNDVGHLKAVTALAEKGTLDAVFLADGLSLTPDASQMPMCTFDPIVMLAVLAQSVEHIGVVATAETTYGDPFTLARRVASLDHVSAGRAGVNIVTGLDPGAAANFGVSSHPDPARRYARAEEFVDVLLALWDSWGDDVIAPEKASGRFLNPREFQAINYQGAHFSVAGPLNAPRSAQGRPVVVQAGGSEPGRNLAARTADVVFTSQVTLPLAQAFYRDVKERAVRFGRSEEDLVVMPGLAVVIGGTEEEALARYRLLEEFDNYQGSVGLIAHSIGADFGDLVLDRPVPEHFLVDHEAPGASQGVRRSVVALAAEGLTVRQIAERFANWHRVAVGAPEQIADTIEEWFRTEGADGFNVQPDLIPSGVAAFVDHVVPELRRRGIFRQEYEGTTLHQHLGLDRPPARGNRTESNPSSIEGEERVASERPSTVGARAN